MLLGQLMSEPSKHKTYKIRAPTTTVAVVTREAGEGGGGDGLFVE